MADQAVLGRGPVFTCEAITQMSPPEVAETQTKMNVKSLATSETQPTYNDDEWTRLKSHGSESQRTVATASSKRTLRTPMLAPSDSCSTLSTPKSDEIQQQKTPMRRRNMAKRPRQSVDPSATTLSGSTSSDRMAAIQGGQGQNRQAFVSREEVDSCERLLVCVERLSTRAATKQLPITSSSTNNTDVMTKTERVLQRDTNWIYLNSPKRQLRRGPMRRLDKVAEESTQAEKLSRLKQASLRARLYINLATACCFLLCCPPTIEGLVSKVAFNPPKSGYAFQSQRTKGKYITKLKRRHVTNDSYHIVNPNSKIATPVTAEKLVCKALRTPRGSIIACALFQPEKQGTDFVILMAQPNATDISDYVDLHGGGISSVQLLSDFLGCRIVVFDYSGFGISSGSATEQNIYSDVHTVYNAVTTSGWLAVPSDHTVLLGFSIGTAAVVDLAHRLQIDETLTPGGIILVGAFTSGMALMDKPTSTSDGHRTVHAKFDRFETIKKITTISSPILFVHGENDAVCPVSHCRQLYTVVQNPYSLLILPKGNHLDAIEWPQFYLHILSFLRHLDKNYQIQNPD